MDRFLVGLITKKFKKNIKKIKSKTLNKYISQKKLIK